VKATAVATPQPGQGQTTPQPGQKQGQTTGAGVQAATTVYTGVVDAQGKTILASALLDSDFLTSDGKVSGQIQDAVVDINTGQLLYLLLEYGGVLDVGDTDLPAPLSAFSLKPDGQLLLNIAPEDLQKFPDVGNDWPQTGNANWDADVRNFWSKEGFAASAQPAAPGNHIRRISDLLNSSTTDAGMGAGTLQDMLVSLDQGRVPYVLVSFDGGAAGADWYAIPLSAFDPENTDNGLAFKTNVNQALLQGAPRFNTANAGQDRFLPGDYDKDWQTYWSDLNNQ